MKKYSFISNVFIIYLFIPFLSWLIGTGFEETSYTHNVCLRIYYFSSIGGIIFCILSLIELDTKKCDDFYSQLLPFLEKAFVVCYTLFMLVYAFSYGINKISIKIVFPIIGVLSTALVVWGIYHFNKKGTQWRVSFFIFFTIFLKIIFFYYTFRNIN